MKKIRTIGYIRVSTTEQAAEGISLDNQRAKIRAYCDLNDLELTEIIEDAGKSGKNTNRPGLQELLQKIANKEAEAVVVYKLDRLSRRVLDTLQLIEDIEKKGAVFHSISEKVDTQSANGKFFLNIICAMNQMERDTISERTSDALQHKISKGERAGQVPYGYQVAEDGVTLAEIPEQQEVISIVKSLHSSGRSYRAICKELTEQGHEPQGKAWHPQTIKNILRRVS